jgi:hypothetical protein
VNNRKWLACRRERAKTKDLLIKIALMLKIYCKRNKKGGVSFFTAWRTVAVVVELQ